MTDSEKNLKKNGKYLFLQKINLYYFDEVVFI